MRQADLKKARALAHYAGMAAEARIEKLERENAALRATIESFKTAGLVADADAKGFVIRRLA